MDLFWLILVLGTETLIAFYLRLIFTEKYNFSISHYSKFFFNLEVIFYLISVIFGSNISILFIF